jgi:hypothetical protein
VSFRASGLSLIQNELLRSAVRAGGSWRNRQLCCFNKVLIGQRSSGGERRDNGGGGGVTDSIIVTYKNETFNKNCTAVK